MYMIKYHYFFLLSLCLIGELWTVKKLSTIDGEFMLIETAGFLFMKSCNTKIKDIVLPIIKIYFKRNLLSDDVTGGRVAESSYEKQTD